MMAASKINFHDLVSIGVKQIREYSIVNYDYIKELCARPYPGYPDGCPNRFKCRTLGIRPFEEIKQRGKFDEYYLIYARFDFKTYKELRRDQHPDWSDKQLGNSRHWQAAVKKKITTMIENATIPSTDYVLGCGSGLKLKHQQIVGSMENACINVFSTMRKNGIKDMEVRPENVIYLVCLLCRNTRKNNLEKWIK